MFNLWPDLVLIVFILQFPFFEVIVSIVVIAIPSLREVTASDGHPTDTELNAVRAVIDRVFGQLFREAIDVNGGRVGEGGAQSQHLLEPLVLIDSQFDDITRRQRRRLLELKLSFFESVTTFARLVYHNSALRLIVSYR